MNIQRIMPLGRMKTKHGTKAIAKWLWQAWRGNRRQAILNVCAGIAGVVLSLLFVNTMQRSIDIASGAEEGSLYLWVSAMAVIMFAEFGVNISRIWIKNILGIKAQNEMQRQMLDRLLRAEWKGRDRHHSGDITNRLENDVSTVVTFLTETLPNMLSTLLMFLGAFTYLCLMDYMLALITVGMLPIFLLLSRIYISKMRKYTRRIRNFDSKVQSILQETVQNRMLIKTLECGDMVINRLDNRQINLRHHVKRRTRFSVLSNVTLHGGFAIGFLIAFLWSTYRLSQHAITFGAMTAFLQLVNRIQTPAKDLTRLAPAFVAVLTAAERLIELEEMPQEEDGENISLPSPCGIKLCNVSFGYDDGDENIIDNLSFDFPPGSCTAVLGETGAGKTTLIRLLLGLLKPKYGTITIYNDEQNHNMSALMRCNMVYVPQGNTLMSGTIRDNLLMADPNATDHDMMEALHTACADFVTELPEGLYTTIDEKGGGLSEGQSQRITIARALLRKRSIMLFDEATSALDPETEKMLLTNILKNKEQTIIFITHRMAVLEYCDKRLNMDDKTNE
ncbi:MAG: ABC transporter ATP-binding protein [Prevotella sp.]|nr:ABC transporter ATP-binding protein [Prevotellaceae bacterium]MDY5125633.1 ABC transporter ATP-binding protein [Prevotella sp.]MDY5251027.1 ABC transporter ATP-binding protein [Prevotella sp.]